MFFPKRFLLCVGLILVCACAATESTFSPTISPPPTASANPTLLPQPKPATTQFLEATPNAPLDVRGAFVYSAGDGSLWRQDAQADVPSVLVERSTESIAQLPAFSPDGERVVYSALLFLADGALRGDLRSVNVADRQIETLVRAEANEVVYLYPRFARDGRLLVTRAENLQTAKERAQLEWIDVQGGGGRTRVLDDARDADVARDGKRIAFVRYDNVAMRSSLWLANADGSAAIELVNPETFTAILSPRFSPDGKWLAFSVHGAPQKNLPLVSKSLTPLARAAAQESGCVPLFLFPCFARRAAAHSAPGALWRVNLETKKFQQLTDIYDDSPAPAWSDDGAFIALHDFTGIRLIDLAREKIFPLFLENGGSGGFDWRDF